MAVIGQGNLSFDREVFIILRLDTNAAGTSQSRPLQVFDKMLSKNFAVLTTTTTRF